MNKTLILSNIINELFNGSKSDFARKLDVKPQTISSWLARNTYDTELIFAKCENISAEFLLTGEGAMLKTAVFSQEKVAETAEISYGNSDSKAIEALKDIIKEQARDIARLEMELERVRAGAGNVPNVATA